MNDSDAIRLERCDPPKNMLRYYVMQVLPNLFGEWCLLRVWGRIGRRGQMRTDWFATKEEATNALEILEKAKRRRGYQGKQTFSDERGCNGGRSFGTRVAGTIPCPLFVFPYETGFSGRCRRPLVSQQK